MEYRESGAMYCIQVNDGSAYSSIGGGYQTNGTSTEVIDNVDKFTYLIEYIEYYIRSTAPQICSDAAKNGISFGTKINFKLIKIDLEYVYLIEQHSQYNFNRLIRDCLPT